MKKMPKFARSYTTVFLLAVCSGKALAWKPTTHVALAEIAIKEIVDTGKVSIFRVNYETGQVLGKIGEYPVDKAIVDLLKANRKQYRAGVLGPDAYPDMMTGQMAIHPGEDPADEDKDVLGNRILGNEPGEGADAWLTHLWNKSRNKSGPIQAWTYGYLTHAAGDLFMHTFVNNYAGGRFNLGTNALRHIVLEGYVGKRAPSVQDFSTSLNGVTDHIYETLVKANPGTDLGDKLLVGSGTKFSIPYQYSQLRASLKKEVDAYDDKSQANKLGYDIIHPGRIGYLRAWIQDIDQGLQAFPAFSHQIALALFFNPSGEMDIDGAKAAAESYVNKHLLSMSGLPDAVGGARDLANTISKLFLPADLIEFVEDLKEEFINNIFEAVTGMSLDDIKDKIKNPQNYFNTVLGPGSAKDPGAVNVSLANLNRDVLGINDSAYTNPNLLWDSQKFAPAYNTVTMTKLLFLSKESINDLIRDVRRLNLPNITSRVSLKTGFEPSVPLLTSDNVMLGWQNSLDDDNEWHKNKGKLIFIRNGTYEHLFMKQIGEDPPGTVEPLPPIIVVTLKINRVKQIDSLDPIGAADFYAKLKIDVTKKNMVTVLDDNDINPGWTFTKSTRKNVVDIRIRIYDEDGGLFGADDKCDINPASGEKELNLKYDLSSGKIFGDLTGTKGVEIVSRGAGDSDRAEIRFTIN